MISFCCSPLRYYIRNNPSRLEKVKFRHFPACRLSDISRRKAYRVQNAIICLQLYGALCLELCFAEDSLYKRLDYTL